MRATVLAVAASMLAGCALVRHADGERVAIEHEMPDKYLGEIQSNADEACIRSGGKAPAKMVSNLPVNQSMPEWMVRKIATFRCS